MVSCMVCGARWDTVAESIGHEHFEGDESDDPDLPALPGLTGHVTPRPV